MKTMRITDIMADFLDSIRDYEHESGEAIYFDERESSEFVSIYFDNGDKFKIEEQKPLFITEDGVEIFAGDNFIIVEDDFTKQKLTAYNLPYTEDFIRFYHESNADEYIWRNKRVFSYNDIEKFQSGGEGTWWNVEAIAKERS